jgi:hypothetical protein
MNEISKIKERYPKAYTSWTTEEKQELVNLHRQGFTIDQLSAQLGRQPTAIQGRLGQLGEIDLPEKWKR